MDQCNKRKRLPSDSTHSEPHSKVHRVAFSSDSELTRVDSSDNSCQSQLTRVDSLVNSCESELVPPDSFVNSSDSELFPADSYYNSCESQLARVESVDPCLTIQTQDDLFNILDSENVFERDSAIHGLDSVIKSFEEEICAPGSGLHPVDSNSVPDCSEVQTNLNLGYLLEASDDELGLPPTVPESEKPCQVNPDELDLSGFVDFEDDIPNYDGDSSGGRTLTVADLLFDYTESLQAM